MAHTMTTRLVQVKNKIQELKEELNTVEARLALRLEQLKELGCQDAAAAERLLTKLQKDKQALDAALQKVYDKAEAGLAAIEESLK